MALYFKKAHWKFITRLLILGHLLSNITLTCVHLYAAVHNYPGGHALQAMHQMLPPQATTGDRLRTVHIDVYSAQTGVTRFGQTRNDLLM